MNQPLEITFKPYLIGKTKRLRFSDLSIVYGNVDNQKGIERQLMNSEVSKFRYGIKWINGLHFAIGRIYSIDIEDKLGNQINLRLRSLYGINKKSLGDAYVQIVNYLYDNYFTNISKQYLNRFDRGESFELAGVNISAEGIYLNEKSGLVTWKNLGSAAYATYYTLYPKSNPNNYSAFNYLDDWNTGVLYSVSRQILINKELSQE